MTLSQPLFRRFEDHGTLVAALAESICATLNQSLLRGSPASLVLPGGRTPVPLFEQLSRSPLSWESVTVTLTDERWVDAGDAASNERLLREHLLRNAATGAQVIGLKNPAVDAEAGAALAWNRLAAVARPFDVVVLGMGEDGHFASLFPGDAASARGLSLQAAPACIAVRAPAMPSERVSLTLPALLQSRQVILLTTGSRKWELLQRQLDDGAHALPVRALLMQRIAPLTVFWSP